MAEKMATGVLPVEKDWQQIKEEITCSICGDLFTDPKTIPCLHTFCKECIEKSIESNKKMATAACCPLCRTPISCDAMESVSTNFTINRLVEILGKRGKEGGGVLSDVSEIICGNCEEGLPAVTWCVNCESSLCNDCNIAHKRMNAFESHVTVAVEEFIKNPSLILSSSPEKAEACKSHSKQPLDLYCRTCSSLICRDCMLKDHPRETHDFDFVDEVVDEEREKIKEVTAPLKGLIERMRTGLKRIEECEEEVDTTSEANIRKIRGTYDEVYRLLRQQEEEVLQKVDMIKTSLKKTLAMQKENSKFVESQLVSCVEFCDNAVMTNRSRQLLTYKNSIIDRAEDLMKQVDDLSRDPECSANDMLVRCAKPAEFISGSVCDVSGPPHLPHCNVTVVLSSRHTVKVTVTLKDICGFGVPNQSRDLELRCNKEEAFVQDLNVDEQSNGVYHIQYNPKRKEDHLLSVEWRGRLLNDEEVKVVVNVRDYTKIKDEVMVIDKYGPINKQLKYPYLLAKGPNNELIVRNLSTCELVIFDEQLEYSHVIGGRGSGDGKFLSITGIAVDKKSNCYVADGDLHCIQKFTLGGQFVSQFGSEGTGEGQFKSPYGLVMSQSDQFFVCDYGNDRIEVFKNEVFSFTFGQRGSQPGFFNHPLDLTLNNTEDLLFITDCNNDRVQVFTVGGQFVRIFGNFTDIPFKLRTPVGIYYTADDHLLISSFGTHCVLVFEEDGSFVSAIEGTQQGKKRFRDPGGVVMMSSRRIVISDPPSSKLIVF